MRSIKWRNSPVTLVDP